MKSDKTALVTGATGAIGRAIVKSLAVKGYDTVLVSRDPEKTARTTESIAVETGSQQLSWRQVDLSRRSEIMDFAASWQGPLHVLVNNAAVTPPTRQETPEGIELQFATNVLGYYWMTAMFSDILADSAPARVVNVASYWAGGMDLTDLEFERRPYSNDAAYRQSKQADRMISKAFAERFPPELITVNSCHPGDVSSTLSSNLGFGGHETPAQAAATPVWLAVSPDVAGVSGGYFEHLAPAPCPFSRQLDQVSSLYAICESYD